MRIQKPKTGTATGKGNVWEIIARFFSSKHNRFAMFSVLISLAVVVSAIAVKDIAEKREYNSYYSMAQDYFYAGDYESALGSFRRAYEVDQRDDCSIYIADCYIQLQRYDKAMEILKTMDVKDANVASRIDKISAFVTPDAENTISIAGLMIDKNSKSISLDDMDLESDVLQELSKLSSMESLSLANNRLTDIGALARFGGLVSLNLSGNEISDITALAKLKALRSLVLDENPIEDLSPLYGLTKLTSLSLKNIKLTDAQLSELSLALPDCAIRCENQGADCTDITLGGISFKSDVTELNLSGLSISDISALSSCKSLKKLLIANNSISDLSPLMDLPKLSYLDASNNDISDLRPLMGMQRLSYLNASDNEISSTVCLGNVTSLRELNLNNNPITDFSGLKKLSSLNVITLSNTGINDEGADNLSSLSNLMTVDLRDNASLSGEAVDKLKASLTNCQIMHSELSYSVLIGGRQFKNSDTDINLSSLALTDIQALSSFLKPESVNLANNSISNIFNIQFFSTIKTLNLSGNSIEDCSALAKMSALESLDISNNNISYLGAFYNLSSLKELTLTGNPLTEEALKDLREQLPNCKIYF